MTTRARATASPDLVECVSRSYGLSDVRPVRDLGGSYNLNLLIESGSGPLVIRAYGDWVTAERLTAVQDVREHLRVRNWPVAELVRTPYATGSIDWDGRRVEVERYVPPGTSMSSWPLLTKGMGILGRLHDAMLGAPTSLAARTAPVANHVAASSVIEETAPAIATIHALGLTSEQAEFLRAAELLVERLRDEPTASRATRLVHGDFWDNNVYFQDGQLQRIGDFDFMGERDRIDDIALTLFYAGEHFGRQDPRPERLDRLRRLVDAYDDALEDGLTTAERVALPYAIVRSPLTFLRDMADQAHDGLGELERLRGPEYVWGVRMLDNPAWLRAFR
jgi:homoserine kinase type II